MKSMFQGLVLEYNERVPGKETATTTINEPTKLKISKTKQSTEWKHKMNKYEE